MQKRSVADVDWNGRDHQVMLKPRVFIVDDDPVVLRAISRVLRAHGFTVEEYSSAVAFLERLPCDDVACALVDLKLPALNGLDVQKTMARKGLPLPIVFLSGQGDAPSTAHAMREGAIDFLVKPLDEARLLDAITRACTRAVAWRQEGAVERERDLRLARLTKREREVCDLVARGLLNRQIAYRARHRREDNQGPPRSRHAETAGRFSGRVGSAADEPARARASRRLN